jgi:hypothetical protein
MSCRGEKGRKNSAVALLMTKPLPANLIHVIL